jgi:hypothetical protein
LRQRIGEQGWILTLTHWTDWRGGFSREMLKLKFLNGANEFRDIEGSELSTASLRPDRALLRW